MQARPALALALIALAAVSCKKKGFGSGFEGAITMHIHSSLQDSDLVVKTKDGMMRFEVGSSPHGSYMLFDPKTSTVTMVNDSTRTYSQVDFARPGAPKPNTSPDTAQISKSGKHETIAGVDCEDWTVHDHGKRSEVCVARGVAFFDMGSLKSGHAARGLAKELRDEKLFPLRDVEYDASGKELSRMEVTKVEKKSLDDAELSVPKGYAKVVLPGM